jgi:TPR repeat protein
MRCGKLFAYRLTSTGITVDFISIGLAITLTEWSDKTLRRRVADRSINGKVERSGTGRMMVDFAAISPHICIPLEDEDIELVMEADSGEAAAQNDLALLFLENGKPKSAIYWLELATKQDYPDAMHWLAHCYFDGNGVAKNENLGLMWLARAAAAGHDISKAQMQVIRDSFTRQP